MNQTKFSALHIKTQEIIDALARQNKEVAHLKISEATELIDALLDFSEADADIVEISKYQILINQLQQKLK
ncbi:MAG: hypothetical protein U0X58_01205 [Flavobacteriaceae bacterium]